MARYIGPKTKIARKFSDPIFGPDKYFEKRKFPPGQHGPNARRGKKSDYAYQLAEKQKAKYTYGILERQFSNIFKKASKSKMVTGVALLQFCELRLDNLVYRLGLANTRNGARQLVSHKHITVNNEVVNIPSYCLKPGDIIEVRDKSKKMDTILESMRRIQGDMDLTWLGLDKAKMRGTFHSVPDRDEMQLTVNEQLVVELYSK